MQHHWLNWDELESQFPKDGEFTGGMRLEQRVGLRFVVENGGSGTLEIPTGVGKTAMAVALARTARSRGKNCVVVTPTKTVLEQIRARFPNDFTIAVGRNDFPCFLYEKDKTGLTRDSKTKFTAGEIPHAVCKGCPHFVCRETGETNEKGTLPCPYYKQGFEVANSKKPILATLAFYLFKRLFSKDFPEPDLLVIDEAHRVPETVRSALSYDITDWHLEKAAEILKTVEEHEAAEALLHFRKRTLEIVGAVDCGTLLDAKEITELMSILEKIDAAAIQRSVAKAIRADALDIEDEMKVFKKVEGVVLNLRRYIRSLELSLPLGNRGALAYTYAYHTDGEEKRGRVTHKLVVCSHYIAALVKKCLLGNATVALSATIGDNAIFEQESGIVLPFLSVPPRFPSEHTAIYMPTDTPDLAYNTRKGGSVTNVMRRMARSAKCLAKQGIRSLHVVIADEERTKLLSLMEEEGVKAVSYGNGVTARTAASRFKDGEGDCLVGTMMHFSEGVDLPRKVAGAIFVLRPPYPPPKEPRTQFEVLRYGNSRWAIWNWRVMLFVLQVRGRNIRSEDDLGVTIFISQQFRRVVFAALPKTLQSSYKGDLTLDQCVKKAITLLG